MTDTARPEGSEVSVETPIGGGPADTGIEAEKEQGFTPGQGTVDLSSKQEKADPEPQEDTLDILVPKKEPKVWKIGPEGGLQREYVQKPLSFIAKAQWFALVGGVLDKALSGPNGLRINNLLSAPGRPGELRMEDFRDADTFVAAIAKLLEVAPGFLLDSYLIWLAVPDYEREIARDLMQRPEDEGGLSDAQGMEIIETFIDQNYEALDRFFREQVGQLQKRIQTRAKEAAESRSSRR